MRQGRFASRTWMRVAAMLLAGTAMATSSAFISARSMALFLTLPYGKFAHAAYRSAALLEWSVERRQPSKVRLTEV